MKTRSLFILLSTILFVACNNYEDLDNEKLITKSSTMEYPIYHIVYDPMEERIDMTLDPTSKSYDPGPYTHLTYTIHVERTSDPGPPRTYYGAFPIKGRCWVSLIWAYEGKYTVYLYLNGIEIKKQTFIRDTSHLPAHNKNGTISSGWEEFSE